MGDWDIEIVVAFCFTLVVLVLIISITTSAIRSNDQIHEVRMLCIQNGHTWEGGECRK